MKKSEWRALARGTMALCIVEGMLLGVLANAYISWKGEAIEATHRVTLLSIEVNRLQDRSDTMELVIATLRRNTSELVRNNANQSRAMREVVRQLDACMGRHNPVKAGTVRGVILAR